MARRLASNPSNSRPASSGVQGRKLTDEASQKLFTKTAKRVRPENQVGLPMRGGIRL